MTTDFDTTMQLASAAAMECLGTETVVYTPRGGTGRAIAAVIQRLGIHPEFNTPWARIKCRQSTTLGLDAAALDTGGDTISWSPKRSAGLSLPGWELPGVPASIPLAATRQGRILQILSVDGGFVTVEVA